MEQKKEEKRKAAAAKTKEIILESSTHLFIKKGFEGVSISEIAKRAEINQSLIYHYFKSKEDLWKSVKNNFISTLIKEDDLILDPAKGLKSVLKKIVLSRFEFFSKNPNVFRMIGWQRLEIKKNQLSGGTLFSSDNWKETFIILQKNGEIRKEIDIDMMIIYISSVITGIFTEDYQNMLSHSENKTKYLNFIINSFILSFS